MRKVFHVHTLKLAYSEDPDIEMAAPLYEWANTDAGKYIIQHSEPKPFWNKHLDPNTMGCIYTIHATLTEESYTFYKLKFC